MSARPPGGVGDAARPSVSVVVPAHNAEAYVAEAVRSALDQTYPPVEVVCVDDGSTDGTLGVLRGLEREHPDTVRVLYQSNAGAPAARNRGVAEVRGDYVQFLDADDVLLPTKLERQAALVASARVAPDLVMGAFRSVPFVEAGAEPAPPTVQCQRALEPWTALLSSQQGITSSNLWRREAVLAVGGWEEGLPACQDSTLVFRLLQRGGSSVADLEPLTIVRRRPDSVWNRDRLVSYRMWFDLNDRAVEHLRGIGQYTPDRQAAAEVATWRKIQSVAAIDPDVARSYRDEKLPPGYVPPGQGGRAYRLLRRALGRRWAGRVLPLWRRARGLARRSGAGPRDRSPTGHETS